MAGLTDCGINNVSVTVIRIREGTMDKDFREAHGSCERAGGEQGEVSERGRRTSDGSVFHSLSVELTSRRFFIKE
jgi:hypothetical protein